MATVSNLRIFSELNVVRYINVERITLYFITKNLTAFCLNEPRTYVLLYHVMFKLDNLITVHIVWPFLV